jgi:adenylyltransferase/sulfurtransferase
MTVDRSWPVSLPGPLVEPTGELTAEETARYSRHLLLPEVGVEGQRRLKSARVLVVGAGGLGAPILTYLAAAGVGVLGVVDDDVVDVSNLQRQVLFEASDVGLAKVDASARRLRGINPHIEVVTHRERIGTGNALDLFARYDLVLDGTDNFATRYLVNDACVLLGLPYVWGSVFRFEGQISVFWERYGPQYRDLYSEPPPAGLVPSCAEGGVLGSLCAMVGAAMASEAVKLIVGAGTPLVGRLLVLDALDMRWRSFPVARRPDTLRVASLDEWPYEARCSLPGPDEPPADAAAEITAQEVRALLADTGATATVALVDVREPFEHALGAIDGSLLIPRGLLATEAGRQSLRQYDTVILYCKSGMRSQASLRVLKDAGYRDVRSLIGGMDAW